MMNASDLLRSTRNQFGDILRCPSCGGPVEPEDASVVCATPDCLSEQVAVCRDGLFDFVSPGSDDRGQLKGFGYQWDKLFRGKLNEAVVYGNTREDLRKLLIDSLGIEANDLTGLRVLDLGCGHGQYASVLAGMGAKVLGCDLSEVVYRCAVEHGSEAELDFMRADVLALPFPDSSFDIVISIGMVHHTPEPRAALHHCARLVKPGGRFLLYYYETGEIGYVTMRHKFPLPARLPRPLQLMFCRTVGLPLSVYLALRDGHFPRGEDYQRAVLGLFDAYSPTYSWTNSMEVITGWLREEGLGEVKQLGRCLFFGKR